MPRLDPHDLLNAVTDLPERAVREIVQKITQFFFVEDGILDFNQAVCGADAVDKVIEILDAHGINEGRVEMHRKMRLKSGSREKKSKWRCPRCGSRRVVSIVGGYLERGPYDTGSGSYADEQQVDGHRCLDCATTFCTGSLSKKYDKARD